MQSVDIEPVRTKRTRKRIRRKMADLLALPEHATKIRERLLANGLPEPNSGCIIWLGHIRAVGYGHFSYLNSIDYAHRVSWQLKNGPIPTRHVICHICDVRLCVNPDHLFCGTQSDNIRDMIRKGRAGWHVSPERYAAIGHALGQTQRGEGHSSARLSDQDIATIRYLIQRGAFFPDIARVFEITSGYVSNIAAGARAEAV
ncbi:MAG: HNH endonuclease [Planctomycetes bacterium]|nr:HNH endonuclease [Planctomycetota bacterium]